jgi:hypothetical protein
VKTFEFFATTCPDCNRAAGAPFRSWNTQGKIVLGCVNEFHTGQLVSPSASASWHARPEAKKIRAASKAMRGGGVTLDARSHNDGVATL